MHSDRTRVYGSTRSSGMGSALVFIPCLRQLTLTVVPVKGASGYRALT